MLQVAKHREIMYHVIQFSLATPHTYLADDSEFQNVIREVTEEYIERRQDEALIKKIKNNKKLRELDALFLSKIWNA